MKKIYINLYEIYSVMNSTQLNWLITIGYIPDMNQWDCEIFTFTYRIIYSSQSDVYVDLTFLVSICNANFCIDDIVYYTFWYQFDNINYNLCQKSSVCKFHKWSVAIYITKNNNHIKVLINRFSSLNYRKVEASLKMKHVLFDIVMSMIVRWWRYWINAKFYK